MRSLVVRFGLGALLAVSPAAAQDPRAPADAPPVLRLTVEEARARAKASAPTVEEARALERAARADVGVARAARLPQVDFTAGYRRQSNVPELTLAQPGFGNQVIYPNIPNNYRTRLGGSLPLYTGGRLGALQRAAERDAVAAGHDVTTADADLALETTAAYWSLVTARQSEQVLAESLAAYEAHLQDAQNRRAAGLAALNEVLQVQVERDRAELARVRAANDAEVAEEDLRRLLGVAPATRIEPAEPLAEQLAGSASAADTGALVTEAFTRRPERTALQERITAGEERVKAEKATRLPQLSLVGGYDYANPNYRILPPSAQWDTSWDVSVNLSWALFDGGRSSASAERARARTEALRHQAEDLDRQIRLQVTARELDVEAAQRAVDVAARNLEAARENSRVAAERNRAGVIPSSERLDAEVLLLQAGLDHTQALAQLRTARAALDRAVGR
jgi:outer membrane protein TolC